MTLLGDVISTYLWLCLNSFLIYILDTGIPWKVKNKLVGPMRAGGGGYSNGDLAWYHFSYCHFEMEAFEIIKEKLVAEKKVLLSWFGFRASHPGESFAQPLG
jgi:hypothetical protein